MDSTHESAPAHQYRPPEDFPAILLGQLPPPDRLKISAFGDVSLSGAYGVCALAVDESRLYYGPVSEDGQSPRLTSLGLEEIRDVRIENLVGNGAVIVVRAGDSVEVARFTQTRAGQFEPAVEKLREIIALRPSAQARAPIGPPGRKLPRCPKCGRTLSARAEICVHCADKRKLFVRLVLLLRPHAKAAAAVLSMTLTVTLVGLLPPVMIKLLIDKAILPGHGKIFALLLGGYGGAIILSNMLNIGRIRLTGWLGQRVIYELRKRAFDRLQELSLRYYESRQTGKLINRLTSDIERVERFVVEGVQELIIDVVTLAAITGILFYTNWRLALITILPTPIIAVMVYFFARRLKTTYRKSWRASASMTAHLADIIPGVRVVKGFAREREEAERFDQRSSRLFELNLAAISMRARFFPFVTLLGQVGYILIWAAGGYLAMREIQANPDLFRHAAQNGTVLSTVILFGQLLWRFYDPIGRLSQLSDQTQRATTSAERVFELLDAFPEVTEPADPVHLPGRARGRIEFRNVGFSYESHLPVLKEINLTIEPGEMVGIVGHSGVGKSTLAGLLMRFYDPDAGQVLLDGVDIRQLPTRELRGNIGLVLQEPTLFHGTVAQNVCYGHAAATPRQIVAAAQVANAHRFLVRLPEGYDTEIGERGVRLSQGEKQRVSIARAVLPDPPILILDEATASVDTETERLIQSALERLTRGRSVLAIAHRLSTLRRADRIVVLSEGRIAEIGTHDELLAREGLYYQLCMAQSMMAQAPPASPPLPLQAARLAAGELAEMPEPPVAEEMTRDAFRR